MPRIANRPTPLAWQVFRGSEAVQRSLLTEHQLRGSAWTQVRHDVYADARLDRDHALACQAVVLRLPPGVMIAGPSASFLHGVDHAASYTDEVHVLVPRSVRVGTQRGIRVHSSPLDPPSPDPSRSGVPGSRPQHATLLRSGPTEAAWETAVWLEPVRAVGIVDTLLARHLTDADALRAIVSANEGRPGNRRASWVFDLADPAARSPSESHLRIRLVLAGLPRPVARHPVRLPTGRLLHPDLAWPEFRVAVEYDGQWPADADRSHPDRDRLQQLAAAGWLVLPAPAHRLHRDFPALVRQVRSALTARGWRTTRGR
ncbi:MULTISPECIES: hypothetical protein [Micromonospora]|nr:hypothetical protein [Micromonospora yangpuensis]